MRRAYRKNYKWTFFILHTIRQIASLFLYPPFSHIQECYKKFHNVYIIPCWFCTKEDQYLLYISKMLWFYIFEGRFHWSLVHRLELVLSVLVLYCWRKYPLIRKGSWMVRRTVLDKVWWTGKSLPPSGIEPSPNSPALFSICELIV
jgi:hypothetical protein